MGIREDFEKDFDKDFPEYYPTDEFLKSVALWAAKWAMERCAESIEGECSKNSCSWRIRQLVKDLHTEGGGVDG